MRRLRITLAALALVMVGTVPARADISVGTSLGLAIHDPEGSGQSTTLIGIPSQAGVVSTVRPGFRFGTAVEDRKHEGYADITFDRQSSGGSSLHALRLGVNYQYNFDPTKSAPYVTFGGGLYNISADGGFGSAGATSGTIGGGFGLGVPVSENHGRFRVEARVDHLFEGDDGGFTLIDAANVFQLNLGFDLWMK